MMVLLYTLLAIVTLIAIYSLSFALRERRRRKGRPLFDTSAVQQVDCADVDPVFAVNDLGPGINTEALLVGDLGSYASTTLSEAWILCVLAKRASTLFEFGTCSGRTTYMLARNSPPEAIIGTITLTPETVSAYKSDKQDPDSRIWTEQALKESSYTTFLYSGTPEAVKIRQLYGDSKDLDETEWLNKCDLIFIDGSHAYSYVKSDTEKACRMVKENGFIIWHDFSPACPGVWKYLSELALSYPIRHIKGTRLCYLRWNKAGVKDQAMVA